MYLSGVGPEACRRCPELFLALLKLFKKLLKLINKWLNLSKKLLNPISITRVQFNAQFGHNFEGPFVAENLHISFVVTG